MSPLSMFISSESLRAILKVFFIYYNVLNHYKHLLMLMSIEMILLSSVIPITGNLHQHIENQGIEFLQFTFRWMNNLLMRELPLRCTIRLWDTYLVCFVFIFLVQFVVIGMHSGRLCICSAYLSTDLAISI